MNSPARPRRICVVLVDRANYGRLRPVMQAIREDPALELACVCAGSMLLERFGQADRIVEADGFRVDARVHLELEGSRPVTMAKSVGLGIIEFTTAFERLAPDLVLLIGDRYETLAAAVSAAYMNLAIAHIQGGEVSGSIDESARHAITKLAHLHFPATARSADFLVRMGERPEHVFNVGCPAGDYIIGLDTRLPGGILAGHGLGPGIDTEKPFLLVIHHPVTTAFGAGRHEAEQLLHGLEGIGLPALWLWPNIDAGADDISKAIRVYREHADASWLHLVKNLEPEIFQKLLKKAACAVGNSSSFVRDSTFSGTPVVLVGNRQWGREHGENLVSVPADAAQIASAVRRQLAHGRYAPGGPYGDGRASARIVERLKAFVPYRQKLLSYVDA